ncbi:MAG: ribose-5-phosphate isomerase RpiA [Gammaproteobacteria bacterium]|nr:ribose-5-phosphate isomerase RpiA [Gammaproteobacteria bacterium]
MAYSQDDLKRQAAKYAMKFVAEHTIIGVGTGSTVNYFIEELAKIKGRIDATVSSSKATTALLKKHGLPVVELNHVDFLPIYIDGADEAMRYGQLIKGAGGALLQEKILASSARQFVCIIDESKLVKKLGNAPVPVEVIPSARSLAGRELVGLGGDPIYREHYVTDNGNIILDVERLKISNPVELEEAINHISGVVCSGIFAKNPADILVVATQDGIHEYPEGLS